LITSEPPPDAVVCNTTPLRYFCFVDRFELLVRILGGQVRVPRQVFDPEDDLEGPDALLSEIGRTTVYWQRRGSRGSAIRNYSRLRELRLRTDLEIVDLTPAETTLYAELTSRRRVAEYGLRRPLGSGEAAVLAVAELRRWAVALDDSDGRKVLRARYQGCVIWTTQELLKRGVAQGMVTTTDAVAIYSAMLDEGYIGPSKLWD
jgi:predicted nucleic acid-binding protein